jgi:hypothetical protein
MSEKRKRTPNKRFYEMAALPSFEKNYYFRRVLLVGKCVKAATT